MVYLSREEYTPWDEGLVSRGSREGRYARLLRAGIVQPVYVPLGAPADPANLVMRKPVPGCTMPWPVRFCETEEEVGTGPAVLDPITHRMMRDGAVVGYLVGDDQGSAAFRKERFVLVEPGTFDPFDDVIESVAARGWVIPPSASGNKLYVSPRLWQRAIDLAREMRAH